VPLVQGLPGVVLLVLVLGLLLVLVLALLLVPVLLVGLWSGQLLRVNNNMVSLCVVIGLLFVPTGRRAYLEQHIKLCKQ
jgi:hypothetical protein